MTSSMAATTRNTVASEHCRVYLVRQLSSEPGSARALVWPLALTAILLAHNCWGWALTLAGRVCPQAIVTRLS
jgi:hypothetical protein